MNDSYLFDSSVWINHFKQNNTAASGLLAKNLAENKSVLLCTVTVQEVLQGCKTLNVLEVIEGLFEDLKQIPCQHYHAHIEAAKIYFTLRKKGISIRKPNDCLIAFYALENDLILVHDDIDFERIKEAYPLKTFH
jgi:hypothetical protein